MCAAVVRAHNHNNNNNSRHPKLLICFRTTFRFFPPINIATTRLISIQTLAVAATCFILTIMSYASSFYERRSSSSVLVVGPQQQQQRRPHHQHQQQRLRARSVVDVHRRRRNNHFDITHFSPTKSHHSSVLSSSSSLSDDTVVVIAHRRHPDYNFYFESNSVQASPPRDNYHYNYHTSRIENYHYSRPDQNLSIRYKSPTFPFVNDDPPRRSAVLPPIAFDQQAEKELATQERELPNNIFSHSRQILFAKCDYDAESDHELSIRRGETLQLIDNSSDWWMVENEQREIGFVPSRLVVKADGGSDEKFEQLSNKMGLLYSIKKRLRSISASSQPSPSTSSVHNGCRALASAAGNGGLLLPGAPYHYGTGTGGQKCSDDFERPPVWSPPRRMNSNVNNNINHPAYQQRTADTTTTTTSSSSAAGSSSLSPPTILRSNNITADSDDNNVIMETVALFDYRTKRPDELALSKNDKISVLEKNDDGWWRGINRTSNSTNGNCNREGWFPSNFVRELYFSKYSPTRQQQSNVNAVKPAASQQQKKSSTASSTAETEKIPANTGTAAAPAATATADVALPYSAMYPFKASNDDELSFERHEVLTILDHPSCGHNWLRARSADGHIGLVPRNFIEPLSRVHTPEKMLTMLPVDEQQQPTAADGKVNKSIKTASKASSSSASSGAGASNSFMHDMNGDSRQPPVTKAERNAPKSTADGTDAVKTNRTETTTNGDAVQPNQISLPHKDNHSMSRRSSGGAMPTFIDHDTLKQRTWYYGRITRAQCDDLLNRFGTVGEFLVRDSETGSAGDFAISLRAVPRNKHFKVQCDVAKQVLCIGSRQFASLDAIIEHYQQTPICTLQSGDKLHLKMPLKAPR